MKKNNKGFFLAETIVMIALVTTVMAFVYPNITKLYENFVNKALYYDQTEDIYTLKAVYQYFLNDTPIDTPIINYLTTGNEGECDQPGEKKIPDLIQLSDGKGHGFVLGDENYKLEALYITSYMSDFKDYSTSDYEFYRYLRRMKKITYDTSSYRLIGKFTKKGVTSYASIKIDNPNPNRNCNLGGDQ